jgi:hypothetical protein
MPQNGRLPRETHARHFMPTSFDYPAGVEAGDAQVPMTGIGPLALGLMGGTPLRLPLCAGFFAPVLQGISILLPL